MSSLIYSASGVLNCNKHLLVEVRTTTSSSLTSMFVLNVMYIDNHRWQSIFIIIPWTIITTHHIRTQFWDCIYFQFISSKFRFSIVSSTIVNHTHNKWIIILTSNVNLGLNILIIKVYLCYSPIFTLISHIDSYQNLINVFQSYWKKASIEIITIIH